MLLLTLDESPAAKNGGLSHRTAATQWVPVSALSASQNFEAGDTTDLIYFCSDVITTAVDPSGKLSIPLLQDRAR